MQEEVMDDKSALSALPVETILHLFTFFDPKTLIVIMLVCKKFKNIAETYDKDLWEKFLPAAIKPLVNDTYKTSFFKHNTKICCPLAFGSVNQLLFKLNEMIHKIKSKNEPQNVFGDRTALCKLIEENVNYVPAILHSSLAAEYLNEFFLEEMIKLRPTCINIILNHADMLHQHINIFVLKLMVENNTASVKKILNVKCEKLLEVIDDELLKQMLEVDPECIALIQGHKSLHIQHAFIEYKKIEVYVDKKVIQKEEEQRQIKETESSSKCLMM